MAADGLGDILLLGYLVTEFHLKGLFIHASHKIRVKGSLTGEGIGLLQVGAHTLVASHIDLPAALHPQKGFDQPVHIVAVRLIPLIGAVDEGAAHRHLAPVPLHRNGHRLFGGLQKSLVESENGEVLGVQLGNMADRRLDAQLVHNILSSLNQKSSARSGRAGYAESAAARALCHSDKPVRCLPAAL